jgi:hypothetical protein
MHSSRSIAFAAAAGLILSLAACSGTQGGQGPQGQQGAQGDRGSNGISTGTIAGALTTPNGTSTSPVPGVTVSLLPDVKITATTAADGKFSLTVPVGVYTVVFTKNPGITTTQVAGVSVVAGGTATVTQSVAYSPIRLAVETEKTPASQEYLRFMDDAGIETVATYMRWVYFRKRADGTPFEIYSDLDSRIAHYQRVLTLFGSLTAALLPIGSVNIINLTHAGRALPFILPLFVLYIAIETLFVTQTVQLAKRVRALKAQKQLFE